MYVFNIVNSFIIILTVCQSWIIRDLNIWQSYKLGLLNIVLKLIMVIDMLYI